MGTHTNTAPNYGELEQKTSSINSESYIMTPTQKQSLYMQTGNLHWAMKSTSIVIMASIASYYQEWHWIFAGGCIIGFVFLLYVNHIIQYVTILKLKIRDLEKQDQDQDQIERSIFTNGGLT